MKTAKVRFGYVNVFTPTKQQDEDKEKYSVMVIIDKKDKVTLAALKEAIEEAKIVGKDKTWGGKIPAKLALPLRDGDEERPDSPELAGKYFLNAKSQQKPGVVKRGEDGQPVKITEPMDFQSGDYGKASLALYPYSFKGNNGVGVGLNSIFFMEKGEPLAGSRSAAEEFADEFEESEEDDWMK